jgi:APA family basic amino acid/polyamine antiporter
MALVIGAAIVIGLYLLANVAYLVTLPLSEIQHAPADRVGTAAMQKIFPGIGAALMAAAIMVSTVGTVNALTLTGARACYAMAKDRLFFRGASQLNAARVPARALWIQGVWSVILALPRTFDPATGQYGNLYNNLLEYIISATLIFYILTIIGIFRLRVTKPHAERPYRAWGYPWLPILYIVGASVVMVMLFVYRPTTTWPGLAIVALGIPVYAWIARRAGKPA